ncbi:helix-turn-helix domain-containing protein [Limibacterium fermenti]|uniref:helix-turn-helix domain-containing protein n=1 Tax=Limibacterium fermenti TaxID=3229863 RepID=UPI003A62912C
METKEQTIKNTHHGHAIKRYRHALGIKQEALAADMGISQTLVSFYEKKKVIEDDMVEKFAKALNVAPELIKELEEDPVTFIIENNTFEKGSMAGIYNVGDFINNPDPIDRFIELSNEKTALYERIVELEKEKNALFEKFMKDKK